jgi:hypothetical protein
LKATLSHGKHKKSLKREGVTIGARSQKKMFFENFCKKYIPRGNFMRQIDSAHSRSMKRFLDPDLGNGVGVLKRKSNIFGFS